MSQPSRAQATIANFAAQVPVMSGGNTPFAARYARELREIATRAQTRSPRSVQRQLGPSELGAICDRLVVGKMCGEQPTNHVKSTWPSIVGTAVHAWLADAFTAENTINGYVRWVPEQRVRAAILGQHPGTADLYDSYYATVVDHKVVGPTTIRQFMSPAGPSRKYRVQGIIYGQGYIDLGLPVHRVIFAAWPRTAPTLDELYCWEWPWNQAEADEILREVAAATTARKQAAQMVMSGQISIDQIRRTPGDECFLCDQYRPQSALDGGPGCPGQSERA